MEYIAIAGAVLNFVGSQKQASAQKKSAQVESAAAEETKKISLANAARVEAETAETYRRQKADMDANRSLARARAAASGGTETGSTAAYLDTMAGEDAAALAWLQKSGKSQADIIRREGDVSYMVGKNSAREKKQISKNTKLSGVSDLFTSGADIYSTYF